MLVTISMLTGCLANDSNSSFQPANVVPPEATDITVYVVNFEGDASPEHAVRYLINEPKLTASGDEIIIPVEYAAIYEKSDDTWSKVFEKAFPNKEHYIEPENDSAEPQKLTLVPASHIEKIIVTDVSKDEKEGLLITTGDTDYVLVGLKNGTISAIDSPRGFGEGHRKMRELPEFYGRLLDVATSEEGIIETWGGLCEGGTEPCYTFEIVISFDAAAQEWNISEARNIEKIDDEYDAYLERYPDAQPWTNELPF